MNAYLRFFQPQIVAKKLMLIVNTIAKKIDFRNDCMRFAVIIYNYTKGA